MKLIRFCKNKNLQRYKFDEITKKPHKRLKSTFIKFIENKISKS